MVAGRGGRRRRRRRRRQRRFPASGRDDGGPADRRRGPPPAAILLPLGLRRRVRHPGELPARHLRPGRSGGRHAAPVRRDRVRRGGQVRRDPRRPHQRLGLLPPPTHAVRRPAGAPAVIDDELWSAIGDPTRRRMLDLLLANGGGTATSLSEQLPVTRQAVAKHLGVLDRAGLVHSTPSGRERRYTVDEARLSRAITQLTDVSESWDRRLQRIKRIAETIQRTKDN